METFFQQLAEWLNGLVDELGFAGALLDAPRWVKLTLWGLAFAVAAVILVAVAMMLS